MLATTQLQQDSKNEIIEILSVLTSEAATPKDRQRTGVMKTLLSRLRELVGLAKDLGGAWNQWGPMLNAALGGQP